ncbi:MAG: SPASM domain-containing protein [Egibacteraceae bacterium]
MLDDCTQGKAPGSRYATHSYDEIKRRNAVRNLAETREGKLVLESWPRFVMVELTQGCNLRCSMCRSRQISYRERAMDRSILAHVAEFLFPTAELVDIRGWGESLIAPDVLGIIALVDAYGARCRVVTNLSFSRADVLDALVEQGTMIDVSLDAATQSALDVCRTGARFDIIDGNLRRLVAALETKGVIEHLRIIATLQRTTLDELATLVRYIGELGIKQIVLNEVTLRQGDPNAVTGREAEVDRAVAAAVQAAGITGIELYAGTALGTCAGLKKNTAFCIHPWSYATIGFDGSVGFCDHLIGPMMPVSCMGDITATGFEEIWNGPAWQELRRWHASPNRIDSASFGACSKCYKHRNVDFEDMFEPLLTRYRLSVMEQGNT